MHLNSKPTAFIDRSYAMTTLKHAQDLFPDLDLDDELYDMFCSDDYCDCEAEDD